VLGINYISFPNPNPNGRWWNGCRFCAFDLR